MCANSNPIIKCKLKNANIVVLFFGSHFIVTGVNSNNKLQVIIIVLHVIYKDYLQHSIIQYNYILYNMKMIVLLNIIHIKLQDVATLLIPSVCNA